MRPILALLVALSILGGVGGYSWFIRTLPPLAAQSPTLVSAPGHFTVDITLTFNAAADSFSLEPTSVLLRFEGKEIRLTDSIQAGEPTTVEIPNLRVGSNELYLEVHAADATLSSSGPVVDEFSLDSATGQPNSTGVLLPARAVRLRVLRDGIAIHEQTLWSEPGQPVIGTAILTIARETEDEDEPH